MCANSLSAYPRKGTLKGSVPPWPHGNPDSSPLPVRLVGGALKKRGCSSDAERSTTILTAAVRTCLRVWKVTFAKRESGGEVKLETRWHKVSDGRRLGARGVYYLVIFGEVGVGIIIAFKISSPSPC